MNNSLINQTCCTAHQVDVTQFLNAGVSVEIILPDQNRLRYLSDKPVLTVSNAFTLEMLSEQISRFLYYLEVNENRTPNTLKGYRLRLNQFLQWLGKDNYTPSDKATWQSYHASLKNRGLSVYTQKGHYHILHRFADWLVKNKLLLLNPLDDILPPKPPKNHLPKAILREHIQTMLTKAVEPRDKAMLLFFRDTGCRACEALSLTWGDIDFVEGCARVEGKQKERFLFFDPVTCAALEAYRKVSPYSKHYQPIWCGTKGELSYNGLYKAFKRLAKEAGLDEDIFNPHAWRHAFERDTTKAGIPTAQLQDLMGHSSIATTKIYAQFNTVELKEAHNHYSPVKKDYNASFNAQHLTM